MKEAYIEYENKDGTTEQGWFKLKELNSGYITFLTKNNTITIPISRVIRIKERGGDSE